MEFSPFPTAAGTQDPPSSLFSTSRVRTRVRCREHPLKHPPFCSWFQTTDLSSKIQAPPPRGKLKVPPRPFLLEEHSHNKHSGSCKSFSLSLSQTVTECGRIHTQVWKANSNKRRSVLGTNHTKIYRVNLVGFKHSAEDPSRSPHHQNKYTLRSKRFSNVLSKHQGRFLETVPEAKHSQTELPITSDQRS